MGREERRDGRPYEKGGGKIEERKKMGERWKDREILRKGGGGGRKGGREVGEERIRGGRKVGMGGREEGRAGEGKGQRMREGGIHMEG